MSKHPTCHCPRGPTGGGGDRSSLQVAVQAIYDAGFVRGPNADEADPLNHFTAYNGYRGDGTAYAPFLSYDDFRFSLHRIDASLSARMIIERE